MSDIAISEAVQVVKRGRGRPKQGGRGQALTVRVSLEEVNSIVRWLAATGAGIGRPVALRVLAELR